MQLSVVIPTLNESRELPETLQRLQSIPEVSEILVSDGGSQDDTLALARSAGARTVSGRPGRGGQLRRGAEQAQGEVVVLLHADTWLPPDAGTAIRRALLDPSDSNRPAPIGGGFRKEFRDAPRLVRCGARARSAAYFALTGVLLGDQALFVRRHDLVAVGGVPDLPLMEEFALTAALRRRGRLVLLPSTVCTSGRRFHQRGPWRTWWLMWRIQWAWYRGVSPEILRQRYGGK